MTERYNPGKFSYKQSHVLWEVTRVGIVPEGWTPGAPSFIHKLGDAHARNELNSGSELRIRTDPRVMNQMYEDGMAYDVIAAQIGLNRHVTLRIIDDYRKKAGLPVRKVTKRGSYKRIRVRQAEIEKARGEGKSPQVASEELGIPLRTVQKLYSKLNNGG